MNLYERQAGKSSLAIGEEEDIDGKVGTTLIQEEDRMTGNILVRAFYQYAVACGGLLFFLLTLFFWGTVVTLNVLAQW